MGRAFGLVWDLLRDVQGKNQEQSWWWFGEEWKWRKNKYRQKQGQKGPSMCKEASTLTWCTLCLVFSLNPVSNSSSGQGIPFCVHVCVRSSVCAHAEPLVTGPDLAQKNACEDKLLLWLSLSFSFGIAKWKRLLRVLQTLTGKISISLLEPQAFPLLPSCIRELLKSTAKRIDVKPQLPNSRYSC